MSTKVKNELVCRTEVSLIGLIGNKVRKTGLPRKARELWVIKRRRMFLSRWNDVNKAVLREGQQWYEKGAAGNREALNC